MLAPPRLATALVRPLAARLDRLNMCVTADDVAQLLREARVVGHRFSACACPIAAYLRRADALTYSLVDVAVTRVGIVARDRRNRPDVDGAWFALPIAALVFTTAFDRGAYPDLRYVS